MATNSERIEEAVNSPLAYWDREKGGSLEREALTRNRRGIILFTSPEDAQGDSGEAWDSIYSSRWEDQEARVEEEVAAVEPRWQCLHDLPYFSHLRVVTEGLSPGARALEIGCGTAETGFFLGSQYGLDVYGIDVATHAVEVAAARFDRGGLDADRLSVAVIEELPFDDDTFDLVFGKTVYEHFEDPEAAAREVARVTAAGGHLVLDVPNTRNAYWTLASERARGHTHLTNVYRIEELCGFFMRQGFRIDQTWGEGLLYTTPYILLSSLRRALHRRSRAQAEAAADDSGAGAPLQGIGRRLQALMGPADRLFKAGVRLVNAVSARLGLVSDKTGVLIGIVAVREPAITTTKPLFTRVNDGSRARKLLTSTAG